MSDALKLLKMDSAFVIAPAGCGKTQLIAEAISVDKGKRSLVLTHTHAGVDAIRNRLKKLGSSSKTYEICTIAGWCLRLTNSFPITSGIPLQWPDSDQWLDVYKATKVLLSVRAIKKVIQISYTSLYVDEYQDCTLLQHDIVLALSDILPTKILGDPLQGIFNFDGQIIINWKEHVEPNFRELRCMNKPYRWMKTNPDLGKWLLALRERMNMGDTIELNNLPKGVQILKSRKGDRRGQYQIEVCLKAKYPDRDRVVAIYSWENQCHEIARRTGGKFKTLETIECKELFTATKVFDNAQDGASLAKATFEFCCVCLTKVKADMKGSVDKICDGQMLGNRKRKYQLQLSCLETIVQKPSLHYVRTTLINFANAPDVRVVRQELFQEMLNSLREFELGDYSYLEEAAIRVRDRTRRLGRSPSRYVVSRTLLIKGLEFDHSILLDAEALNRNNLYVALTRASISMKIICNSDFLNPT